MPKRTEILDRIKTTSPCSASWEEMVGNEQVRFCLHCSAHVHDLTKTTRKDALKLLAASGGRLCLRYIRRADGSVVTAETARPLTQIKRRLSRVAAGAFTATLSLASSAAAQTARADRDDSPVLIRPMIRDPASLTRSNGPTGSVAGTITDPNQAAIPNSTVVLVNEATGRELSATTDEEGKYQFQSVEAGTYSMKVSGPGFAVHQQSNVVVPGGGEQRVDAALEVGEMFVQGGSISISPETPLVKAIWGDDMQGVRNVLALGVDVNAVDAGTGTTALGEAVSSGNVELIRMLIYAGADPNQRSNGGRTPLMRLDEDSTGEVVRALVEAGAKVNLKDDEGETALHVAAAVENAEVLRALIDAGAKVNARTREGKTALMIAAEEGYVDNVKALLWAGADVQRKDEEGTTALKYARGNDHKEVSSLLITYGAIE